MNDYLSDTNVLSELARPLPNPGVISWATQVSIISLSVVTVDEIFLVSTRSVGTRRNYSNNSATGTWKPGKTSPPVKVS